MKTVNYPAASNGVSIKILIIASKAKELNPYFVIIVGYLALIIGHSGKISSSGMDLVR
jgi:hypothetical protein